MHAHHISVLRHTPAYCPCLTQVRVWDTDTGGQLAVLEGHEEGVTSVAFCPVAMRVASVSKDKTVRSGCAPGCAPGVGRGAGEFTGTHVEMENHGLDRGPSAPLPCLRVASVSLD